MPASSQGLPTSRMRSLAAPQDGAGDAHGIDIGPVRRVPLQLLPARDGAALQLLATADHVEGAAGGALPDGQRQAPVALLGDHPVAHRAQPVELALVAEAGQPADVIDHVHDLVAQAALQLRRRQLRPRHVVDRAHVDVPLVHHPEQQRRAAAPAVRVAVRVRLQVVEEAARLEVLDDAAGGAGCVEPAEPAEVGQVVARFVERRDDRQPQRLAEAVVLRAAARRDVHDAGALGLADLVPGDDAMLVRSRAARRRCRREGGLHGRQLVERPAVAPAHQLAAGSLAQHRERPAQGRLEGALAQPEDVRALADLHVGEVLPHRRGHVGAQRPRRGGPHQQPLAGAVEQREAHRQPRVLAVLVALVHLHLAHARAAARAPRHRVVALVQPAALVALGQEAPDEVVVLVGEGEVGAAQLGHAEAAHDHLDRVGHRPMRALHGDRLARVGRQQVAQPAQLGRVVPVHPHAEADGLLGLLRGVGQDALLAEAHEAGDAVALDVALAGVAQLALDVDLHPQALAVEAVLPALVLAEHGVEALVEVLVGAAPGVVDAHRVVGGDGPVEEREGRSARVLGAQLREGAALLPVGEDALLLGGEVRLLGKGAETRWAQGHVRPRIAEHHGDRPAASATLAGRVLEGCTTLPPHADAERR